MQAFRTPAGRGPPAANAMQVAGVTDVFGSLVGSAKAALGGASGAVGGAGRRIVEHVGGVVSTASSAWSNGDDTGEKAQAVVHSWSCQDCGIQGQGGTADPAKCSDASGKWSFYWGCCNCAKDKHGWECFEADGCPQCQARRAAGSHHQPETSAAGWGAAGLIRSHVSARGIAANAGGYAASTASAALDSIRIADLDPWSLAEIRASESAHNSMRRWFQDVPLEEQVMEDYACTMHSKRGFDVAALLPHGRIFMSRNYVGYSCDIPGRTTRWVTTFDQIADIAPVQIGRLFGLGNARLGNHAIEITLSSPDCVDQVARGEERGGEGEGPGGVGGRVLASLSQHAVGGGGGGGESGMPTDNTVLFASFLFRSAAYKSLVTQWKRSRRAGSGIRLAPEEEAAVAEAAAAVEEEEEEGDHQRLETARAGGVGKGGVGEVCVEQGNEARTQQTDASTLQAAHPHSQHKKDAEHDLVLAGLRKLMPLEHGAPDGGGGGEGEPNARTGLTVLVEDAELEAGLMECYRLLLAKNSAFMGRFYASLGDCDRSVSPWRRCSSEQSAREVKYMAPIKTPLPSWMSVKATRARETQSCSLGYPRPAPNAAGTIDHKTSPEALQEPTLEIVSRTSLLDIPFGTSFDVHVHYMLRQVEAPEGAGSGRRKCLVTIWGGVIFTKGCIFERKIRHDSLEQLRATYTKWAAEAAEEVLEVSRQAGTSGGT